MGKRGGDWEGLGEEDLQCPTVAGLVMPTVTYKNQPGIHKTRGAVPLAGTSHVYTVKKVLWPEAVEDFLKTLFIGTTLHVCCGHSLLGEIRIDSDAACNPDIVADVTKLQEIIPDGGVDTVLCDPPYNGKMRWNHDLLSELCRVASQRIIFQHWFIPATPQGRYKKAQEKWELTALSAGSQERTSGVSR